MKSLFVSNNKITYDGSQLCSHWALKHFNLQGDSIVAFIGPCDVKTEKLVDLIDQKRGEPIYSPEMLHFIAEFFDLDLEKTVLRQRLLISVIKEAIDRLLDTKTANKPACRLAGRLERVGDDLFVKEADGQKKLSVSIATLSPVSGLIHTGLNIKTEGVPVAAAGLAASLNIDSKKLALTVLTNFSTEMEQIQEATTKVRGVS